MVREQYSTLHNKTGKILSFTSYRRNLLLILPAQWLLQKLDKDQRKRQERKVVKLMHICIYFVRQFETLPLEIKHV